MLRKLSLKDDSRSLIEFNAPGRIKEDLPLYVEEIFLPVIGREGCFYKISRQQILVFSKWKQKWKAPNTFRVLNRFFLQEDRLHHLSNNNELLAFIDNKWTTIFLKGDILLNTPRGGSRQLFWNLANNQLFLLVGDHFYQLHALGRNSWSTSLLLEGFSSESNRIRSVYYESKSGTLLLGSVTKGLFQIKGGYLQPSEIAIMILKMYFMHKSVWTVIEYYYQLAK